jgi:glycolate oxidase FAD binding subunit
LWASIGAGGALAAGDGPLWRVSLAPATGAAFAADVARRVPGARWLFDWAGGLVWLAPPANADAHAGAVRAALASAGGGHATLVRAADAVRAAVPPFEPEAPGLASLADRIKLAFDPLRVLNPGRMVAGR